MQTDKDFVQFASMEYGVRAAARVLLTDWYRGKHTIRTIISSWAPPTENDTPAYIADVASCIGQGADQEYKQIGLVELCKLCDCIFWQENGEQIDETTIVNGVELALYRSPQR